MGLHEILLEVFVTEIVIYKFLFLYTNLKDTGALNVHLNYKKKRKEAQICIFFTSDKCITKRSQHTSSVIWSTRVLQLIDVLFKTLSRDCCVLKCSSSRLCGV